MRESPSRLRLSVPRSPQCRTPGSRRRPAAPPRFIYQQRPASTRRWSRGSRGGGPGHMGARAAPEGANNGAGRAPAAPTKGLRGTKPLSRTGAFGCFCHIQKNNNKKKKHRSEDNGASSPGQKHLLLKNTVWKLSESALRTTAGGLMAERFLGRG